MTHVLLTGYTAQHVGNGNRAGYQTVPFQLRDALADAGFQVTLKRMVPEEDLSIYDVAIIGQSPLNSLGSYYMYGALDVIRRARANGVGLMFYADDWQVHNLLTGIRTCVKSPPRLIKGIRGQKGNDDPSTFIYKKDRSWAAEHIDDLMHVVHALLERKWPPTIIPKNEWGELSLLERHLPSRKIVPIDFTPYTYPYEDVVVPPDDERYGAWVLGSLSNQDKWVSSLGLRWPVVRYGGRASKADEMLKDCDLVQRYAQCWGVMSAPYFHKGSGWWRLRHVHTAYTQGILLADPSEVAPLGDAYTIPPSTVESSTIPQLREIANAQRETYFKWAWTKDRMREVLHETINEVIAEAKT